MGWFCFLVGVYTGTIREKNLACFKQNYLIFQLVTNKAGATHDFSRFGLAAAAMTLATLGLYNFCRNGSGFDSLLQKHNSND